ncbi:polysaccharide deacetylase [Tenuifilaceae bacterium CYCD]|nr:polysaccharide deacetylase [Tenuifilaceae bacterium CYCD]
MKILSFDIEEWFHVFESHNNSSVERWSSITPRFPYTIEKLLDTLIEHNVKANFFCIGWITRQYPSLIKKISNLGFEIGSHSDIHKIAHNQSYYEYKEDLKRSLFSIEDLIGKKVISYRAPGFSINSTNIWAFELLVQSGIQFDCSVYPNDGRFGGLPDFPKNTPFIIKTKSGIIKEFPISSYSFFGQQIIYSGGGFFRLLPYSVIQKLFKESNYVMTYFHLRDFDPDQPFNELGLLRRMKSEIGVKTSFEKFQKILNEFYFSDLHDADQNFSWATGPVVNL